MLDRSPGFFDLDDRLAEVSAKGDDLERVKAFVDFEMFRPALEAALTRADRSKGLDFDVKHNGFKRSGFIIFAKLGEDRRKGVLYPRQVASLHVV